MAVSYTLNRFITAKISDVALDTTVAVIKGKKFFDYFKINFAAANQSTTFFFTPTT